PVVAPRRAGSSHMRSFGFPELSIAAEDAALIGDSQERRPEAAAAEGVREHLPPVPEHEPGTVSEDGADVADLDPALGPPAHELDLLRVEMLAADHGGRAVLLLEPLVDYDAAVAE